jgi:hypothetical protein
MKTPCLLILSVILAGCVHQDSGNISSSWDLLRRVTTIQCGNQKLAEDQIGIDSLDVTSRNAEPMLTARVIDRKGNRSYWWRSLGGDLDVDLNDFNSSDADGQRNHLAVVASRGRIFGVSKIVDDSGMALQLGEITANPPEFYQLAVPKDFFGISSAIEFQDTLWFTTDAANPVLTVFSSNKLDGKSRVNPLMVRDLPSTAKLFASNRDIWVIYREMNSSKAYSLKYVRYGVSHNLLGEGTLIDDIADLDKWNGTIDEQGSLILGFFTGNSMLGAARINTVQVNTKGSGIEVARRFSQSLGQGHVSDLVAAATDSGADFLFTTWLDEESTIANYRIQKEKDPSLEYYGVFPQGTALIDAFTYRSSHDINVLTRLRSSGFWAYSICRYSKE